MEQNNFSSTTGATGSTQGQNDMNDAGQSVADRARDMASTAQEKLADVGSTVRDRAGSLKDSLADALESGADKIRARGTNGGAQYAGTDGSVAMESDGRMSQVTDRVAGGMEATADWLRDADLEGLRTSIEAQVKEHPGRTLLIAAGLGYVLGKAFRK